MEECVGIACTVLLGLLGLWYFRLRQRVNYKLPPGPRFSLFGRLFGRCDADATSRILSLRKYGDVCCMHVMGVPCIYLNTHEKIREFFVTHGDQFSGRIDMRSMNLRFTAGRGIASNDGLSWQENRRFVLSTLRDFGFGRGGTEQIIQNELQQLVETFAAEQGRPFNPLLPLNTATCNVITLLALGERGGSDDGFAALYEMMMRNFRTTNQVHDQLLMFFMRLFGKMPAFVLEKLTKQIDRIYDYLEAKVADHKAKYDGQVNDLIDSYLHKLQENGGNETSSFTEKELYAIITDLYVAGMETTASSLRWALFLMLRNQQVQKRVQAEIDEAIGSRMPQANDRKQLAYTDAVLMEVQRFATLTPLGGLHHRCTEHVKFEQFEIPENSVVYANIFAAHRDDSIWPDPFNFNPENFFDSEKKSVKNSEFLIPFGVGRRSCLGESLAKQELFVFFVGLLQQFEILPPPDGRVPLPSDCFFGNLRVAPQFQLVMKRRVIV